MSILVFQLLHNTLITTSIYAFIGVSLSLSYGLLRILNFAHGHLAMLGGYFFYLLRYEYELSFMNAGIGTLALALPITYFIHTFFIQPFLRYNHLTVFVSTLALGTALEALISLYFGVRVQPLGTEFSVKTYSLWGVYTTQIQLFIILLTLLILPALALCIHNTPLGRRLRALASLPESAQSIQIPHTSLLLGTFVLSTALTFCGGVMIGFETGIYPTMGYSYTIKAFAVLILGGVGNIWGTVVGSFILGFLENFSVGVDLFGFILPTGYRDAFSLTFILGILLLRPHGLSGSSVRET